MYRELYENMENKEIQELCKRIKDKLNELEFTEFTLYAFDYCGELDFEIVEEKVSTDTAGSLEWYFKVKEDYSGYSAVYTYARKIKIKDDELVFDLEDIYEDIDGGEDVSSYRYYEDQTISEILDSCPEEMVISGLKSILNCAFDSDVVGLNRLK